MVLNSELYGSLNKHREGKTINEIKDPSAIEVDFIIVLSYINATPPLIPHLFIAIYIGVSRVSFFNAVFDSVTSNNLYYRSTSVNRTLCQYNVHLNNLTGHKSS